MSMQLCCSSFSCISRLPLHVSEDVIRRQMSFPHNSDTTFKFSVGSSLTFSVRIEIIFSVQFLILLLFVSCARCTCTMNPKIIFTSIASQRSSLFPSVSACLCLSLYRLFLSVFVPVLLHVAHQLVLQWTQRLHAIT